LVVAEAVDWSSKSVVELEAFLRSRGVDLEGEPDRADLLQAVTALAAEDEEKQQQGGQEGNRDGEHSVWQCLACLTPVPQCKARS
jgi:hypothetical protein